LIEAESNKNFGQKNPMDDWHNGALSQKFKDGDYSLGTNMTDWSGLSSEDINPKSIEAGFLLGKGIIMAGPVFVQRKARIENYYEGNHSFGALNFPYKRDDRLDISSKGIGGKIVVGKEKGFYGFFKGLWERYNVNGDARTMWVNTITKLPTSYTVHYEGKGDVCTFEVGAGWRFKLKPDWLSLAVQVSGARSNGGVDSSGLEFINGNNPRAYGNRLDLTDTYGKVTVSLGIGK